MVVDRIIRGIQVKYDSAGYVYFGRTSTHWPDGYTIAGIPPIACAPGSDGWSACARKTPERIAGVFPDRVILLRAVVYLRVLVPCISTIFIRPPKAYSFQVHSMVSSSMNLTVPPMCIFPCGPWLTAFIRHVLFDLL